MKIKITFDKKQIQSSHLNIYFSFQGEKPHKFIEKHFKSLANSSNFQGERGDNFFFHDSQGSPLLLVGLGLLKDYNLEILRNVSANLYKKILYSHKTITLNIEDQLSSDIGAIVESLGMISYSYNKYKLKTKKTPNIILQINTPTANHSAIKKEFRSAQTLSDSISFAKDLVNTPPNDLNSLTYAKIIQADAKSLKRTTVKVLGVTQLKKEKMNMFLSVNAGSAYEAQLVHLTYLPKKITKQTKHIVLVGKGITFDSGGYSLKSGSSMINMKYDMAGSSTVYAAFRAAVKEELPVKISCFLGMTDNLISNMATTPDSIVKARNGKTVEILNTDAEGRLILGDMLNYACKFKPDALIDAATLTGSVLSALGKEICGLMGNDKILIAKLLEAAKETDEYLWELPIIPNFKKDLESSIADIKNIGSNFYAGSAKAGTFLSFFVENNIPWAHFDIAGIAYDQSHLAYCQPKAPSGLMIRTLFRYLQNVSL